MKNYLILFVSVIFFSSCASNASFSSFYNENKADCEFSISTPAFLANLFIPKDDVQEYKELFKKVKHYKVMIFSNNSVSLDRKFDRFINRKKYATLLKINSDGDKVQLYFLEQRGIVKEVVLKVKSDTDFVVLGLKTNISEKDFSELVEKSAPKVVSN